MIPLEVPPAETTNKILTPAQDTNKEDQPVGGDSKLPVSSEAPQVFISTVEADKAAASQVTKDEGQVGTRPVLIDLPREALRTHPH
jgi:hypothetical protein